MRLIYLLLFLIGGCLAHAQHDVFAGIVYGSSDIFRKNDESHYNYSNSEFGIFGIKEFGWNTNQAHQIKKYWIVQPQVNLGKYTFLVDDKSETIFRANLSGGIKMAKALQKSSLHVKFSLGGGYQNGYYKRLEKGIFFTEKLNVGIEFKLHPSLTTFVDMGAMHVSNANFHALNRGLEVFFVEVGIQIPQSKKIKD